MQSVYYVSSQRITRKTFFKHFQFSAYYSAAIMAILQRHQTHSTHDRMLYTTFLLQDMNILFAAMLDVNISVYERHFAIHVLGYGNIDKIQSCLPTCIFQLQYFIILLCTCHLPPSRAPKNKAADTSGTFFYVRQDGSAIMAF